MESTEFESMELLRLERTVNKSCWVELSLENYRKDAVWLPRCQICLGLREKVFFLSLENRKSLRSLLGSKSHKQIPIKKKSWEIFGQCRDVRLIDVNVSSSVENSSDPLVKVILISEVKDFLSEFEELCMEVPKSFYIWRMITSRICRAVNGTGGIQQ